MAEKLFLEKKLIVRMEILKITLYKLAILNIERKNIPYNIFLLVIE